MDKILYHTDNKTFCGKNSFIAWADIPLATKIGKNVNFAHNSLGTVMLGRGIVIEDDVMIFSNVTIAKADVLEDYTHTKVKGFTLGQGSIICTGARILCKEGILIVGKKSILAANAVLLNSTQAYSDWGDTSKIHWLEQTRFGKRWIECLRY